MSTEQRRKRITLKRAQLPPLPSMVTVNAVANAVDTNPQTAQRAFIDYAKEHTLYQQRILKKYDELEVLLKPCVQIDPLYGMPNDPRGARKIIKDQVLMIEKLKEAETLLLSVKLKLGLIDMTVPPLPMSENGDGDGNGLPMFHSTTIREAWKLRTQKLLNGSRN